MTEEKERAAVYRQKLEALNAKCMECQKRNQGSVNPDRCEMHCTIWFQLRKLETEYSDVTGYTHKAWKS